VRTAEWCSAVLLAALACATLAGCAVRYDRAGVTRVGIGLWGLGDPPGVDWNLDWPRREIPELPRTPLPELPPARAPAPDWRSEAPTPWRGDDITAPRSAIDDNPGCASRCNSLPPSKALATRTDAGGGPPAAR
jgi:hypothetical protein